MWRMICPDSPVTLCGCLVVSFHGASAANARRRARGGSETISRTIGRHGPSRSVTVRHGPSQPAGRPSPVSCGPRGPHVRQSDPRRHFGTQAGLCASVWGDPGDVCGAIRRGPVDSTGPAALMLVRHDGAVRSSVGSCQLAKEDLPKTNLDGSFSLIPHFDGKNSRSGSGVSVNSALIRFRALVSPGAASRQYLSVSQNNP